MNKRILKASTQVGCYSLASIHTSGSENEISNKHVKERKIVN